MPADAPVVRLSTPGDIVAAVPHLCGFVPAESLVAVSLRGERKRIGLTLRFDLPAGGEGEAAGQVAEQVAERLARDGAAAVVLVVYTEATGELPHAGLVAAITAAAQRAGQPVMEALLVRDGRWSSYACRRSCCPPEGTPLGGGAAADALAAAAAYDGRAVLGDRAQLVASLAPPALPADLARRYDDAMVAWVVQVEAEGREAAGRAAISAWREALAAVASAGPTAVPSEASCLRLVVALQELSVRDRVATLALDDDEALLGLLLSLAGRCVAPYDVPVATLLALVAWVRGNGALANVALDRALAADPSYGMATLMRAGLDGQLPPSAVRQWLRETRRTLVPRRRRRAA